MKNTRSSGLEVLKGHRISGRDVELRSSPVGGWDGCHTGRGWMNNPLACDEEFASTFGSWGVSLAGAPSRPRTIKRKTQAKAWAKLSWPFGP
jgi:hypothetical protein